MKRILRFFWRVLKSPLSRLYHFWADVNWRSWFAHFFVTTLAAFAFMGLFLWLFEVPGLGWLVGATLGLGFYTRKEILDFLKYWKDGTWPEHSDDGVGDWLPSFAAWLHSMVMYVLMG